MGDTHALKPLIAALNNNDAHIRREAAIALGKIDEAIAAKSLIPVLKDSDYFVCSAAVKSLKNIGSQAVDLLIVALKDEDKRVRCGAVEVLGEIGDMRAIDALTELLAEEGDDEKDLVTKALKRIRDAHSVGNLFGSIQDKTVTVNSVDAEALCNIRSLTIAEPVVAALENGDARTREIAAKVIERIGKPAIGPLAAILTSSKNEVRKIAAHLLERVGLPDNRQIRSWVYVINHRWGEVAGMGSVATEPLIMEFKVGDPLCRSRIASILGRNGDVRAMEPLIEALTDSVSDVRKAAAEALGKIGDIRAEKPLCKIAMEDLEEGELIIVALALGRIGSDQGRRILISLLENVNGCVRRKAAEKLEELGLPDDSRILCWYYLARNQWDQLERFGDIAVEPLLVVLKDRDCEIRRNAACLLGKIGNTRAVEPLNKAIADEDTIVSINAALSLGEIGDARALKPLNELFHRREGLPSRSANTAGKVDAVAAVELHNNEMIIDYYYKRKAAALALYALLGVNANEAVQEIIREKDSSARKAVADSLRKLRRKEEQ